MKGYKNQPKLSPGGKMWRSSSGCHEGLSALRSRGLEAEADKTLEIQFYDPQGLYAELCKLQNRYAFHGVADFKTSYKDKNPKIPTLFIDGKNMGTLDNLRIQEIKALAEPSPFGRGSKTVYDENVRKASEIKASRMRIEMPTPPREIQNLAPTGYEIVPKLYKLAIYEKDGFFAEHADTLHGENHIGTLVMCLPVPHKGGAFILSDDGNELRLPFGERITDNRIPWVAFYTDVKHKVEVVESGMRMTLQFDLIAIKAADGDEDGINRRLMGEHHNFQQNFRFHDYSEETLEVIKNKITLTLGQEVKPKEEKGKGKSSKPGSKKVMQKRDRPDDDKPIQSKTKKQMKVESESEPEPEEDDDQDQSESFEKKLKLTDSKKKVEIPDCVAVLLKRRYGAITLALDKLKGIDEILYQTFKDDFRVEVKHLILEQNTDCEGEFSEEPIQIIALKPLTHRPERESICSSEGEEVGLDPEHKKVPSRPGEQQKRMKVNAQKEEEKKEDKKEKKSKGKKEEKKEEEPKVKHVFLVSGFSPKALDGLVSEEQEFTGNEHQPGVYAYMHAALFIYPKEKKGSK